MFPGTARSKDNLAEAEQLSSDDVLQVVHAEFVRWLDSATAGPPELYKKIASEIWQLWQGHLADRPKSI